MKKAKAESKAESRTSEIAGKQYKGGVDELMKKTVVRVTDLDDKAVKFFDYLQTQGKANEACSYLILSLEGLSRDHVSNWKGYVYTLLRRFDEEAYKAMKTAEGKTVRPLRARGEKQATQATEKKDKFPVKPFAFNPTAMEFVPGQAWATTPEVSGEEGNKKKEDAAVREAANADASTSAEEGTKTDTDTSITGADEKKPPGDTGPAETDKKKPAEDGKTEESKAEETRTEGKTEEKPKEGEAKDGQ